MRLEYEVNETSTAKLRVCHVWRIIYGGFDIYIYIDIYKYIYIYINMGVVGNCAYMRLEYEVEGKSAA